MLSGLLFAVVVGILIYIEVSLCCKIEKETNTSANRYFIVFVNSLLVIVSAKVLKIIITGGTGSIGMNFMWVSLMMIFAAFWLYVVRRNGVVDKFEEYQNNFFISYSIGSIAVFFDTLNIWAFFFSAVGVFAFVINANKPNYKLGSFFNTKSKK